MKLKAFLLLSFSCFLALHLQAKEAPRDSITVYIFLHEDCIISQHYTLPLKEMYQQYANQYIGFIGLFPSMSSQPDRIEAFKRKYKIPFILKPDYFHIKKEAFGAKVTPEVIVYNETKKEILYKGRINDTYARVGQKRRVTSTSELKDALEAIVNHEPILVTETKAIGCFISTNKISTH